MNRAERFASRDAVANLFVNDNADCGIDRNLPCARALRPRITQAVPTCSHMIIADVASLTDWARRRVVGVQAAAWDRRSR